MSCFVSMIEFGVCKNQFKPLHDKKRKFQGGEICVYAATGIGGPPRLQILVLEALRQKEIGR